MIDGPMVRLLVASILAVLPLRSFAQATAPASAPAATSVSLPGLEPLIAKLSDADWKIRSAAQDAIVALGDDVAPRLQQLQHESADAEVRTAAESMLARIAQGRLTGPTLVTLHLKEVSAQEAFEALGREIGAELRIWPESLWRHHKPAPVTIDADRRPFWSVLKELCEKTSVTPREMGQSEPLTLMQGSDDHLHGPQVISGAFLLVANSATESKSIRYGRDGQPPKDNTSLVIAISCFAEPKLRILSRSHMLTIDEAVDDAGHSLAPPPSRNDGMISNSSERVFSFHVNLKKVDGMTQRLARLRGSFRVLIEARSEKLVIDDILSAKGQSRQIADRRIIVSDVTESGRSYKVKLTILRERRDRSQARSAWQESVNMNAIQMLDAGGTPLRRGGYGGGGSSEKLEYEINFSLDRGGGPPAQLVWDLPVEAKELDVPFEFKDLPLP